jgi:hypothetical protein
MMMDSCIHSPPKILGIDRSAVDFAQLAERQQQQQKLPAAEEGSNNTEAQPMIIRMRGLPFTATEQQIVRRNKNKTPRDIEHDTT